MPTRFYQEETIKHAGVSLPEATLDWVCANCGGSDLRQTRQTEEAICNGCGYSGSPILKTQFLAAALREG